jgi:urease accessory protein
MDRDARKMRGELPFLFTNLKDETGLDKVIDWLETAIKTPINNRPLMPTDAQHHHHH